MPQAERDNRDVISEDSSEFVMEAQQRVLRLDRPFDYEVSMINDAAWVGYELSLVLKAYGVTVKYFPRKRSVAGKTVGVFWNALRSTGIKHVNYALQDAFAFRVFGKTIHLLHCHGTDLFGLLDKEFMRRSKNLSRWGWMIRGNLKAARKVIVSTPDLLPLAKQVREDAEYLPNPIDTDRFSPKNYENEKPKAIGFNLWYDKVQDNIIEGLKKHGFEVDVFTGRPFKYSEMHVVLKKYDVYIDRQTVFSLSKACLEAMSCGLATIDYRHRGSIDGRIAELADHKKLTEEQINNRKFILETHDKWKVGERLIDLYRQTVD